MIKKIFAGLLIFMAVLAAIIQNQPSEFRVERSALIPASPEAVFLHVNHLRNWHAWSPWAKLDPNAKETFEGPSEGAGAVMRWAGNQNVGEGSMTITESRINEFIQFRLEFLKPFKGVSTAEFAFKPENGQTLVTWSLSGTNNFIGKAMSLVFNCDKMMGDQFDQGLANLKSVVESSKKDQ